jgi:Na+/H+ antiporter NhaD/arsenite permease-like protein
LPNLIGHGHGHGQAHGHGFLPNLEISKTFLEKYSATSIRFNFSDIQTTGLSMQLTDPYHFLILLVFSLGYLFIIFEHATGINKATSALLMAIILWAIQFADPRAADWNVEHLSKHLADVSQVILFLMAALTIVEIIHAHGGLNIVTKFMKFRSKVTSLWVISIIAFFLSSVLDNLTTTIVMVMILRKVIKDHEDRLVFGAAVVIAANAGGAWTPIGDVTTTMLWVGGQVSTLQIMKNLFIPSFLCLTASLSWFSLKLKGVMHVDLKGETFVLEPKGKTVFILGVISLISVPIFKVVTGLPPFMGILFAMSFMWLVTDLLHKKYEERQHLRVQALLPRLDLSGILFFLGILLSVNALETAGLLKQLAFFIDTNISSKTLIATIIGLASAVIDNVPLVAACMGMYDLKTYPTDSSFWQLIAFTAGTGGSILIIGSAAGVAFMGMEKVDFFWYLKKAAIPAAIGYFVGIGAFLLLN